jgi:hypothetical protein
MSISSRLSTLPITCLIAIRPTIVNTILRKIQMEELNKYHMENTYKTKLTISNIPLFHIFSCDETFIFIAHKNIKA